MLKVFNKTLNATHFTKLNYFFQNIYTHKTDDILFLPCNSILYSVEFPQIDLKKHNIRSSKKYFLRLSLIQTMKFIHNKTVTSDDNKIKDIKCLYYYYLKVKEKLLGSLKLPDFSLIRFDFSD